MKTALITGITGQDGSYLAEYLLKLGYEVHGIVRRVAIPDQQQRLWRIRHLLKDITLHSGTIESLASVLSIVADVEPTECYHLAAQSMVMVSFEDEFSTLDTNINGTHNILHALNRCAPNCRFYFAGTSELFGETTEVPQNEATPFHPRSPYAVSKATGFYLTRNYRERRNLFAVSGILFNHESPRRGSEFVTRKITTAVARIKNGTENHVTLGNIDSKRDWGFAGDYVKAMHTMLQQSEPDDYCIATNETHTVREFLDEAFRCIGIDDWTPYVVCHSPALLRPADISILQGDYGKAQRAFGWQPTVKFKELVKMMVAEDIQAQS